MQQYAANLEFEKAAQIKKKLDHLYTYQAKSAVVNTRIGTVDIFSILEEGNTAYVNYLAVNAGTVVHTKTIMVEKQLEETAAEILSFAAAQLRSSFGSTAAEIIVPFPIEFPEAGTSITVPKTGDKKTLLALSEKNVNYFRDELRKKKMLRLEDKTAAEKKPCCNNCRKTSICPCCRYTSNVLTTRISRAVTRYRP